MLFKHLTITALFSFTALNSAFANDFFMHPNYSEFKQKVISQQGLTSDQVDQAMSGAKNIDRILAIMSKPGESKPWYEYKQNFIVEGTIQRGVRFKNQYADALRRAEQRYGVPQSVILGILGVETGFGANKGSFVTRDALATLAFGYPRRSEYFSDELSALIGWAAKDGRVASSVQGSYAGAIGFPQFMPTNISKLGVDFDGDGHIDLMNSAVDAIGSIANFLAQHGWQKGQPIGFKAYYSGDDDTQVVSPDLRTAPLRPLGEVLQKGLRPAYPSLVTIDPLDLVYVVGLEERTGTEYFITYPNFKAIIGYNPSRMYATAVWQLGEAVYNR